MKRRSYSRQLLRAKPLRNALLALVSSWNCPKFTKSYVMHACDVFLKYALEIAGKSLASYFHTKTVTSLEEFDKMEEELENCVFNKLMVCKINLIRVNKSLCYFKCFLNEYILFRIYSECISCCWC